MSRLSRLMPSLCLLFLAACGTATGAQATAPPAAGPGDPSGDAPAATGSDPSEPPAPPSYTPVCDATDPRVVPIGAADLAVEPDDGEAPYVSAINEATSSLHVLIYEMGYGGILDAITAKAKAGLDVKVILDGTAELSVNQKYKTALEAAGAEVHWSDPKFPYMHAKTFVVDGKTAVVSTGNYLQSLLLKERNFAATDRDPQDVADLSALFDADWSQASPNLACTRLVVSPENSADRVVALLASATKSVLVESMELSDTKVRAALADRHAAGVDVRVLLAATSFVSANADAGSAMKADGIDARSLDVPTLHVKAIVVDGARAYMGSENLSATSLTENREIGLVLTEPDAVAKMAATIEVDWAKGTMF